MDLLHVFEMLVSKFRLVFDFVYNAPILTFDGEPITLGAILIGIAVISIIIRLVFGAYGSNVNSKTISHSNNKRGD